MPSRELHDDQRATGNIKIAAPRSLTIGSDKACVTNPEGTSVARCDATTNTATASTAAHLPWPSNSTGYRGVRQLQKGKWTALIYDSKTKKRKLAIGKFDSAEAAAAAYDRAATDIQGSRAKLNFQPAKPAAAELASAGRNATSSNVTTVTRNNSDERRGRYRGVVPRRNGKWAALIHKKKGRFVIGTFDSLEEAAAAYDIAAINFQGSRAKLNFPRESQAAAADIARANGSATFSNVKIEGPADGRSAAPLDISTISVQAQSTAIAETHYSSSPESEFSDGYLYLDEIEGTQT